MHWCRTVKRQCSSVVRSFAVYSQLSLSVEEWKDCEELKPKPKDKWTFVDKKKGDEASDGVVRGNQQVSVHEVWKKQQIHEDACGKTSIGRS